MTLYLWLIFPDVSLGGTVSDEEIRLAEEKFEESKQLAETAMYNLLENDVSSVAK